MNRSAASPPTSSRRRPHTVSNPHDPAERQADRAADVVARGGSVTGWSFSSVPAEATVQREEKPKGDDEKYLKGAKKVGEAALETKAGKELIRKVQEAGPVKAAKKALDSTAGKIIAGVGLAGGAVGLAAAKQPLPMQVPEFDISPGISAKITVEGPLHAPTFAGVSLTFKGQGSDKGGPTEQAKLAAETARLRAELQLFKPAAQKAQEKADEDAAIAYVLAQQAKRFKTTTLVPVQPAEKPKTVPAPKEESKDAGEETKRDEQSIQREPSSTTEAAHPGLDTTGVDAVLSASGQSLEPSVRRGMEARFGHDFGSVRLHHDSAVADGLAAQAFTVGEKIVFASGRYNPHSPEGTHLLAHELAHVVQQRGGSGTVQRRQPAAFVVQRAGAIAAVTTLAGLPEADRKRIQVVTTTRIVVGGLEQKFSVKGGKMTLPLPVDTTVVLDSSVTAGLMHGMSNIAAALTTQADVAPAPLPENTTATLQLDLSKYGGIHGLYRFTYHAPTATGPSKAAKRIIIEQLGAAAQVPGQSEPAEPEKGKPAAPDPIADRMKAAGIKHSLSGAKLEALRAAISNVPASHLAVVSGLAFKAAPDDPAKPDVAGDYNPDTHTVTMYAKAFNASQSTFEKGGVATSQASRAIVHEIGHAVDLTDLRKARATRATANAAVNDAAGTFTTAAQKLKYDSAVKAAAAAKKTLLKTTTRSGSKTAEKTGEAEPIDVIGTAATGVPFREAVKKDGKDVSSYAEQDWQESYAEAYSLFLTSPGTLKSLRPATYDYLDQSLPK